MTILDRVKLFAALGPTGRIALAGVTVCALGSLLGGCVDLPSVVFRPPPVELTSPIKADILAADAAKDPYPRFKEVPPEAGRMSGGATGGTSLKRG